MNVICSKGGRHEVCGTHVKALYCPKCRLPLKMSDVVSLANAAMQLTAEEVDNMLFTTERLTAYAEAWPK